MREVFRVIIAGSRDFNDYNLLKEKCDTFLEIKRMVNDIQIVSGGARGADSLGERYAAEKGYHLQLFNADWEKYGKSAGYKRNVEMAENADALIAFWDGQSRGTEHMIRTARDHKLPVRVVRF